MYIPKCVNSQNDWLASVKEKGQPYEEYKRGGPNTSWSQKNFNTILLMILDDAIDQEMQDFLAQYCTAFFTGCQVKVKRPGDTWQQKTIPQDWLES